MADDRFGKTIIMLNKEKVRPSANAKSDVFLWETVALNVMSLWKCKEVMARVTGATSYGNHHLLVSTFPDISLLVKHLVEDAVFEQQLGRGMGKETPLPSVIKAFLMDRICLGNVPTAMSGTVTTLPTIIIRVYDNFRD